MKIKILCFNKISKVYLEIYNYYLDKIKKYYQIDVVEIDEFDKGDIKTNFVKNGANLNNKLKDLLDYQIFLLEINANQYDSQQFAKIIEDNLNFKNKKIAFIIGPSDGFSAEFKKTISNQLSFGKLTLPYNLVKIVLLEQIYRSFKIINQQKYHK